MNINDQDDYSQAVGEVMRTRKLYDDACAAHGAESAAAQAARTEYERCLAQRTTMRTQYDNAQTRSRHD